MDFWNRIVFGAAVVCLGAVLGGCEPSGSGASDDEKEPHFVLGQNRVNAMDYAGAVEAFEESLEVNPHSAAAHYQLAMLYSEKESNPAAAIYHYQQYLRYDPQAPNADIVNQHINTCKQQLATDVLQLPSSPAAQQQLQQLADKNRQLQDEVDKWRAYYAAQMAAVKTNQPPASGYAAVSAPAANSSSRCCDGGSAGWQTAHAHRCGQRNACRHRAQNGREPQRAARGQSGIESEKASRRPVRQPAAAMRFT